LPSVLLEVVLNVVVARFRETEMSDTGLRGRSTTAAEDEQVPVRQHPELDDIVARVHCDDLRVVGASFGSSESGAGPTSQ
jgi:hypothetical protein